MQLYFAKSKILKLMTLISIIIIALVIFLYHETIYSFVGFRLYPVLTDSMEPRIPTYSLVCSKIVEKEEELNLKTGDIITFNANRFGKKILLTHHFNKTEKDLEGNLIYRTNAEGKTELDMYKTKRSDIVGTYVFHIPYLGKIVLFLQSKFGMLMYAELAVIWLVNRTIKARWEEKEKQENEVST